MMVLSERTLSALKLEVFDGMSGTVFFTVGSASLLGLGPKICVFRGTSTSDWIMMFNSGNMADDFITARRFAIVMAAMS